MGEKRHLTARIDADVIDALRQWAAERETSVSAAMEELIVAGLAGDSGADSGAEDVKVDRDATSEHGGADSALVDALREHIATLQGQLDRTNAQLDAALESVQAAQVLQIQATQMAIDSPSDDSQGDDPTENSPQGDGTGAGESQDVGTIPDETQIGGWRGWLVRWLTR